MSLERWFLTAEERGNPRTALDARREPGTAWSIGNDVEFLVHGASYFSALLTSVSALQEGDLLLFTDWRGDPDEVLHEAGTQVSQAFCEAAERGVVVKGLIWRSHLDRLRFSAKENRHLGEEIESAGGECLLDMRVRVGGSHHQKLVVIRHRDAPERDVAYAGGIDLCHSRRDDGRHLGDPQRQPMAAVYGPRPAWHDIQVAIRGPAVADVETVFRERWNDAAPITRNPLRRLSDLVRRDDTTPSPLPAQQPDPPAAGDCAVQLLRTYPRRRQGYDFAPKGERSVARAYAKILEQARSLIYLEDQYLWSHEVAAVFARALRSQPDLRLIAVVPHFPDQDGPLSQPPNLAGRAAALDVLHEAGADRVAVYGLENEAGLPVYVHAKVCVVDDVWATVGSDNFNRRSWTYDSELSVAVLDTASRAQTGEESYARRLRLVLACEHLGRDGRDTAGLENGPSTFATFANSATTLQRWHEDGRLGPRPAGRLRPVASPVLGRGTRWWAIALYELLYDPDGRTRAERCAGRF